MHRSGYLTSVTGLSLKLFSFLQVLLVSIVCGAELSEKEDLAEASSVGFVAMDLVLDCAREKLAAYQIELAYDKNKVDLLGIEGGESEGFSAPPKFDAKGMTSGRIILAALVGDDKLAPVGATRVIRLHLRVQRSVGKKQAYLKIRTVIAVKPGGGKIPVKALVRQKKG